jgi:hypothetical protein
MYTVTVTLLDKPPSRDAWLMFPRPLEAGIQGPSRMQASNLCDLTELIAGNSRQRAYLAKPTGQPPEIRYEICADNTAQPQWLYSHADNRYTRASRSLAKQAAACAEGAASETECAHRLVEHAAQFFEYGHPDRRFNDGMDAIPSLCGTTRASCVDMHGYILATARSVGLSVQYLAGYWVHPERTETHDMHCWLVFHLDGKTTYWDLAHHIKWGVPGLSPGLNPAGGRRVIMSYGRGNAFDTPVGQLEISHFSEPLWLLTDGSTHGSRMRIRIEELTDVPNPGGTDDTLRTTG